jgi:four helix bundle protein
MAPIVTFRDLRVWHVSLDLVVLLYRITDCFPRSETYGLTSQLRRAAVSIPANIAEGNARGSTAAYLNHVNVALGSRAELETLIEISSRLGLITEAQRNQLNALVNELGRLLSGLRSALKRRLASRAVPEPRLP